MSTEASVRHHYTMLHVLEGLLLLRYLHEPFIENNNMFLKSTMTLRKLYRRRKQALFARLCTYLSIFRYGCEV